MNPKFLVLYIIAGTLALGLAIYIVVNNYPAISYGRVALNIIMSIGFYYLAYKTYHEKKDSELM